MSWLPVPLQNLLQELNKTPHFSFGRVISHRIKSFSSQRNPFTSKVHPFGLTSNRPPPGRSSNQDSIKTLPLEIPHRDKADPDALIASIVVTHSWFPGCKGIADHRPWQSLDITVWWTLRQKSYYPSLYTRTSKLETIKNSFESATIVLFNPNKVLPKLNSHHFIFIPQSPVSRGCESSCNFTPKTPQTLKQLCQ